MPVTFYLLTIALAALPVAMQFRLAGNSRAAITKPIELGMVYVWILFLYSVFPAIGIMLQVHGLGTFSDGRLRGLDPELDLVETVLLNYFSLMLGFMLAYLSWRRAAVAAAIQLHRPALVDVVIVFSLAVVVKALHNVLQLAYGSRDAIDYVDSYTLLRGAPYWIQQASAVLSTVDAAATILVVVCLIARQSKRWMLWAFLSSVIVLQIVVAFVSGGSRTAVFLLAFAVLAAKSIYDVQMKRWVVWFVAVAGVLIFVILGAVRSQFDGRETSDSLQIFQSGEFFAVFTTAVDLLGRRGDAALEAIRLPLYFVDMLRFFPQQIVGDLKFDPSTFYVNTFYPYYADIGGGFAFSTIAESVVGFGWPEAFLRGILQGGLFALVANNCLRSKMTAIHAFVYVWFVVLCYLSARDTTFSTFALFLTRVFPVLILLHLIGCFRPLPGGRATPHAPEKRVDVQR